MLYRSHKPLLKYKLHEHRNDCRRLIPTQNSKALFEHRISFGRVSNFDDINILAIQNNYKERITADSKRSDIKNLHDSL